MPRPSSGEDLVRVTIYIPRAHLEALKKIASRRGSSYSAMIREAIRDKLKVLVKELRGK